MGRSRDGCPPGGAPQAPGQVAPPPRHPALRTEHHRRPMAPEPPPRPPDRRPTPGASARPAKGPARWIPWIVVGLLAVALAAGTLLGGGGGSGQEMDYGAFLAR